MSPTEKSDLACMASFDLERVPDLNRQEGETIHLDYQDLYDLASLEKCREDAWRSSDVFGPLASSSREYTGYEREYAGYGSDRGRPGVEYGEETDRFDKSLSILNSLQAIPSVNYDNISCDVTLSSKEYTDLSNKPFIDNSLESVFTVPSRNKKESNNSLKTAIDISENKFSDKVTPIHVKTIHSVTEACDAFNSGLVTTYMRTGDHHDSLEVDRKRWSESNNKDKVSPISVEEDRVREALGMPTKSSTAAISTVFYTNFSKQNSQSSPSSCLSPPLPTTTHRTLSSHLGTLSPLSHSHLDHQTSPSFNSNISLLDNVLDQSYLLTQSPGTSSNLWNGNSNKASSSLQMNNYPVNKQDPYIIKKTPKENNLDDSHHSTRDEKAARNLNIPYSVQFIVTCSMEEFNEILNSKCLSNEQINLCRDIRRRGKNKIAAQNCRKRKIEQITYLEDELGSVRTRKYNLLHEREELMYDHMAWMKRLEKLERHILDNLCMSRDREWEIRFSDNNLVEVVKKY